MEQGIYNEKPKIVKVTAGLENSPAVLCIDAQGQGSAPSAVLSVMLWLRVGHARLPGGRVLTLCLPRRCTGGIYAAPTVRR